MNITHCKHLFEIHKTPNKEGMYINDLDGTKVTYKNNLEHSYNGKPTVEWRDGSKWWFRNGRGHRLYGPAIENSDGRKFWVLVGNESSESEYNEIMNKVPLFYWKNMWKL